MPKSAPRRKRIRTARAEADPTAVPDSKTASGSSPAKTAAGAAAGDRSGSNKNGQSKKGSAGLEREKHLGPVLDKVRFFSLFSSLLRVSPLWKRELMLACSKMCDM